jgi:peptidoglycan/LPS O-acetylase OafA/YrhL
LKGTKSLPAETSVTRNRSIDGLRAVAVILVFWGHVAGDFGWIGVQLFSSCRAI